MGEATTFPSGARAERNVWNASVLASLLLFSLLPLAPEAQPVRRVLVLDIEAISVDAADAAAATRIVAAAASEVEGVEVVSANDLRRLDALQADRSAAGCSDDASCLADIAGALGAESVLFGSLSRLGSTTTASLSLYTAGDGRVERVSVDVADLSALTPALRERTAVLLGRNAPTPAPGNPWFGAVVGGGVAAVVGAGAAVVGEVLIEQPDRDGSEKDLARVVGLAGLGVAVVGVAVGVVFGGLE